MADGNFDLSFSEHPVFMLMKNSTRSQILTDYSRVIRDLFRQADGKDVIAALLEIRETESYFGYEVLVHHSILAPRAFESFSRLGRKVREQLTPEERVSLYREIDCMIDESIQMREPHLVVRESAVVRKRITDSGTEAAIVKHCSVEILYGTDRSRVVIEGQIRYGSDRGQLEVGICSVSIPFQQAVGTHERPKWWKNEFREDRGDNHLPLKALRLDEHSFLEQLRARVGKSGENEEFIFIHGHNVTFEEAARRTALLVFDLGFKGAPIMYSWPSKGGFDGYPADEDNIRWTLPHLREFLRCVMEKSDAKKIHLIAHGLGARGLTDVLRVLAQDASGNGRMPVITNVILLAPDIDAQIFMDTMAPALTETAERVTMYASCADEALRISCKLRNDGIRVAGEGGDQIVVVPGVDSIDATVAPMDFSGHSSFTDRLPLLNDLFLLTTQGLRPERRNLIEKTDGRRNWWVMFGSEEKQLLTDNR